MNILVTDNLFYPEDMNNENTEIYTWSEFIGKSTDENDGFDLNSGQILYVDIETINKEIYDQLVEYKGVGVNVKFITYSGLVQPFIKESVDKVEASELPITKTKTPDSKARKNIAKEEDYYIALNNENPQLYINDSFVVFTDNREIFINNENDSTNKLINNIKEQLESNNIEVTYINDHTTKFENNFKNKFIGDIGEISEKVKDIFDEMQKRFTYCEKYKVNSIYKLDEIPVTKYYIMDINYNITGNNYKDISIIQNCIDSIIRLGKSVGIFLVIIAEDISQISSYTNDNIKHKIFVSGSSFLLCRTFNLSEDVANKLSADKELNSVYYGISSNYKPVIFTIESINQYKYDSTKVKPIEVETTTNIIDMEIELSNSVLLYEDRSENINNIVFEGTTILCGYPGSGKSELLRRIGNQLVDKNIDVRYVSHFYSFSKNSEIKFTTKSFNSIDLANYLKEFDKEINKRCTILDTEKVNNYKELDKPFQPIVLIIDDMYTYIHCDDFKAEDIIIHIIGKILRVGYKIGIGIISSCTKTTDIHLKHYVLYSNRIMVGPYVDDIEYYNFFGDKVDEHQIKMGEALYQNRLKDHNIFYKFKIDNV